MVEYLRPNALNPTGIERRSDSGREIQFQFNNSASIVGMVSLCHTDQETIRDRIRF